MDTNKKNYPLIRFLNVDLVELAVVGVSLSSSVFNFVWKVFNVPLLNIITSYVAEEQALIRKEDSNQGGDNGNYQNKKVIPSMTTSLALAATLGIAETVALLLGYDTLMHIMGIPVGLAHMPNLICVI
ncbi:unnamed protein product [Lupinus luteus]|uniref:Uncharacterized protein n=1 Tax=Lupinus luteus TaxID=3873 RepID=A0AAV1XNG7_LUPLU